MCARLQLRGWPALVGILLLVVCGCGSPRSGAGAGTGSSGPPSPEERFGNDRALVARFAELEACSFSGGRLDYACRQLEALRQVLERGRAEPARRAKLTTTLLNLLESKRELSRLVASESLYHEQREAKVQAALLAALDKERSTAVRTALLHQLCWEPRGEVMAVALTVLRTGGPESLRLEAVECLGRGRPTPDVLTLLRQLLLREPSPTVRGGLCAALGELRAEAAVPELAAKLGAPEADWRCATALAALGSEAAYRALRRGVAEGLEHGRLSAQLVSALLAFSERPFFERAAAVELLTRVAGEERLSPVARQRAAAELGRLGPRRASR